MHTFALPAPSWLWGAFLALLPALLWFDLRRRPQGARAAAYKSAALAALAAAFAGALYAFGPRSSGKDDALAFVAAYLIELSLSVDNLFVFLLLFQSFDVPKAAVTRVLAAGIFGALVLRAAFIGAGVWLVQRFAWLFLVFGGVLVASGLKLLWPETSHAAAGEPAVARLCRRLLPMASASAEAASPEAFFVPAPQGQRGLRCTRLALVLFAVEASDILFALDSVPAGFAITANGWLLFAANALAIVGLRALFVALDESLANVRFLRPALAVVLTFIGGKMLLGQYVHVSVATSLLVICGTLAVAIVLSLAMPRASEKKPP